MIIARWNTLQTLRRYHLLLHPNVDPCPCDYCGRPIDMHMQWDKMRFRQTGDFRCFCLTGHYCKAEHMRADQFRHRHTDGHQRYHAVYRFTKNNPDLTNLIIRDLQVISGYGYGCMPCRWRY